MLILIFAYKLGIDVIPFYRGLKTDRKVRTSFMDDTLRAEGISYRISKAVSSPSLLLSLVSYDVYFGMQSSIALEKKILSPALEQHLIANPESAKTYTDDNFRIIGQARSSFHLSVLESVNMKTQNPVVCRKKSLFSRWNSSSKQC